MKDHKAIRSAINGIVKRGNSFRDAIQETAVDIIENYNASIVQEKPELFDTRLATELITAVGKGIQSEKLVNFFKEYGGCGWNSKEKKVTRSKKTIPRLEAAKNALWYEMKGTENVMTPEEKIRAKFVSAVKLVQANPELAAQHGLYLES